MKILNFGSLNYDYVYALDHMVMPGETISSSRMDIFCGGKGLNQSIAMARAGISVYHAGAVGQDGQMLLEICKENGIDISGIAQKSAKSGHAIIQVDKNSQNSIILYGGTNRMQEKEHIDKVLTRFFEGDYLVLQNEISELDYIIERAYEKGVKIILNPSPFDEQLDSCDLKKVHIFVMNEVEGEQITGSQDEEVILNVMKQRYPSSKVLLTLGSRGAVYQDEQTICRQNVYPVNAVDTTAAGDTFTGYFVSGLIKGMKIEDNLSLCAIAAAIAVSRPGAASSIPIREECVQALKKN